MSIHKLVQECPDDGSLSDFVKQPEAATDAFIQHIDTCEICQKKLDKLSEPAHLVEYRVLRQHKAMFGPRKNSGDLGVLGSLTIKACIGRGGMGAVYSAIDEKLDREVAVKILTRQDNPKSVSRFIREAKSNAKLIHPNVVPVLYFDQAEQGQYYIVMPLITGESLNDRLARGPLLFSKTAKIISEVALGLEAAHQMDLVHRDVKPANILLDAKSECAKITDFGLVRDFEDVTLTASQTICGTPEYMSPEQIDSPELQDIRGDIYSLGITLYKCLTGNSPFRGRPLDVLEQHRHDDPTPPSRLNSDVPRDLESICLQALSKEPEKRYQTAQLMADDLQRFLDGKPTVARPITSLEIFSRWVKRNPKIATLTGLASVLMLALTIGSLAFAYTVANKNQEIRRQTEFATETLVQRVADADAGALLFAINELPTDDPEVIEKLESHFRNRSVGLNSRFNAAIALTSLGNSKVDFIVNKLNDVYEDPMVVQNIVASVKDKKAVKKALVIACAEADDNHQKALRIILLAHYGEFLPWIAAAKDDVDLSLSTEVVQSFPDWHADLKEFIRLVAEKDEHHLDRTFANALFMMDERSLNTPSRQAAIDWLQSKCRQSGRYGLVASARQTLNKWGETPEDSAAQNKNWSEYPHDLIMVRHDSKTTIMGQMESIKVVRGFPQHTVEITRPFEISDTEITADQYLAFVRDETYPSEKKPENHKQWTPAEDYLGNQPAFQVSWFDAVMYCNWLSSKHGFTAAYKRTGEKKKMDAGDNQEIEFDVWILDEDSDGFRLPYEHEFEQACRNGTKTKYFFGTQRAYYPLYGISSNHTDIKPSSVRTRLPNSLGMFEMQGNLWEWCQDWFSMYEKGDFTDPHGPSEPMTGWDFGKIVRSGGVATVSGETDAESRGHQWPSARYTNCGFRIARTAK